MTKHTPGPWGVRIGGDAYTVEAADSLTVAWVTRRRDKPETRLNACLMGSAPDLLAALEMAVATIERIAPKHGPFSSVDGTLSVARAAIAKAEGRG